jgi:hypothetical protein
MLDLKGRSGKLETARLIGKFAFAVVSVKV